MNPIVSPEKEGESGQKKQPVKADFTCSSQDGDQANLAAAHESVWHTNGAVREK